MSESKFTIAQQLEDALKEAVLWEPQHRYILAKKIVPEEKKSTGGIILAGQKEHERAHAHNAIVVAVGSRAFDWEKPEKRIKRGDVIAFTRYEDFNITHSSKFVEGQYCTIYDEHVVTREI